MVDDEKDFCSAISEYMSLKNCNVVQTFNADDFRAKLSVFRPDIVFIDKMISGFDGFELINIIRSNKDLKNLPIIIITACPDVNDRIQALHLGADDLLHKPVSMEELYARMLANLRRSTSYLSEDQMIQYGNLKINLRSHQVYINDEPIGLTTIEYRLLYEMLTNKGEILYRDRLANKFLTLRNNSSRTLDVHITSLRKKLGSFSTNIKTIRGRGYMFYDAVQP